MRRTMQQVHEAGGHAAAPRDFCRQCHMDRVRPAEAAELLEIMLLFPASADDETVTVSWAFLRSLESWITFLENGR